MEVVLPSLTKAYHSTTYDSISPTRHELSVAHKTIIITGGGRGLGPQIARAYAAAGASHVVLIGRTQTTLSKTRDAIEKEFSSVSVTTYIADVADEAAVGKAAEKVGKWDVLILNAGLLSDPHPIEKSEPVGWWRAFEVRPGFHILLAPSDAACFSRYPSSGLPVLSNLDQRQRSNGHNAGLPPVSK